MEPLIKEIYTNVMEGEADAVKEKVQAALDAGIKAPVLLNEGMIAAMSEVGRLFEEGEYFVPENGHRRRRSGKSGPARKGLTRIAVGRR